MLYNVRIIAGPFGIFYGLNKATDHARVALVVQQTWEYSLGYCAHVVSFKSEG